MYMHNYKILGLAKALVPQSYRPRHDLAVSKKIDNRREVAEVAARFYKGCN